MSKDITIFDNFFNDLPVIFNNKNWTNFANFPEEFKKILNSKCDFDEFEDKYVIEAELPGVKKNEVDISFKNDVITISWSSKKENKKGKLKSKSERSEGSFIRSFNVLGADNSKIDAKLENGILTIVLPKKENYKPKKIEIK
jgi:HSP20 family protein